MGKLPRRRDKELWVSYVGAFERLERAMKYEFPSKATSEGHSFTVILASQESCQKPNPCDKHFAGSSHRCLVIYHGSSRKLRQTVGQTT